MIARSEFLAYRSECARKDAERLTRRAQQLRALADAAVAWRPEADQADAQAADAWRDAHEAAETLGIFLAMSGLPVPETDGG